MKRIILLALLALALPTAALANSFDFPSGNFVSGTTSGAPIVGSTLTVSLVGTTNTINIMTGVLVAVTSTIFKFNGGTVSVPTQGPSFQNLKLDGGFVSIRRGSIGIEADLLPGSMGGSPGVIDGSTSFDYHFSGTHLTQGAAGVQLEVPEPGTLEGLLLGIGVFGLAGMKRRKLQLGT